MKKLGMIFAAGLMTMGLTAAAVMPVAAESGTAFSSAVCGDESIDPDLRRQAGCEVKDDAFSNTANNLINIAISIIGLIAVVVIVIGGIQYAVSLGDPGKITQARNMIIYGVIGLVVAIMAWAIVRFVVDSLSFANNTGSSAESSEESEEEATDLENAEGDEL